MSGPVLFWLTDSDRRTTEGAFTTLHPGEGLARHLSKSLRGQIGDVFHFVNPEAPTHILQGVITSLSPLVLSLTTDYAWSASKQDGGRSFSLAIGLLKGEGFDDLIEPLVCLGNSLLVPLITDRSQVHWSIEQFERKRPRFESKIRESSQLSGRPDRMGLLSPKPLSYVGERRSDYILIFDEDPDAVPLRTILLKVPSDRPILGVTGPEGGWSDREREFFREIEQQGNGSRVSLGQRILPGRLAPLVVASILSIGG